MSIWHVLRAGSRIAVDCPLGAHGHVSVFIIIINSLTITLARESCLCGRSFIAFLASSGRLALTLRVVVGDPDPMTLRRCTVEHPFGTIKAWMGHTHFLTRRLKNVGTEMTLTCWRTASSGWSR